MEDLHCWQSKFKSCPYSDKLINKIMLLNEQMENKVDLDEIKKGIYYAKKYHAGQKRESGEPYYSHPLAVAELVAPHCFKTDILVTSILHDTIEDTALTKDMIEYIFDANIASKVDDLTRVKSANLKVTSAEIIKILWIKKKEDLLIIKLCDRLHNMLTIKYKSINKQEKSIKETLESFLTLSTYFQSKINNMFHFENLITTLCCVNIPKLSPLLDQFLSFDDHFQLDFPAFENEKYQF